MVKSGYAQVMELVDMHAWGACAVRHMGSSPFLSTIAPVFIFLTFIYGY